MSPRTFKQFALFKAPELFPKLFHGGGIGQGKRKIRRPLDPKRALHLVLKSSQARGMKSFLQARHAKRIENFIEHTARHYGIKVYRFVNVGNHLHLLVKFQDRSGIQNFLRIVTGKIALWITEAKKGQKKGKFWDQLCFTRVVSFGNDFNRLTKYFVKNQIESFGYGAEVAKALLQQGAIRLKPVPG